MNPPFNDSDTALRGSAFPQNESILQVVSEAMDNNANFALVQHFNRTKSSALATLRGTLRPKMLNGEMPIDELNSDHVATP